MSETDFLDLYEPARREAEAGAAEGGIPIGSALWLDGDLLAVGRNQRVQRSDPILHAEIHCLQRAGRLPASDYHRAVLVTTLSPCDMCTGAILLFGIRHLIVGENRTFLGGEALLRARNVEVAVLDDAPSRELLTSFITDYPTTWNEDIGVADERKA